MNIFPLMLMAACLLMTSGPRGCYADFARACEGSWAYPWCASGDVISIQRANYGRHDKTTCSSGQLYIWLLNTACSLDVTSIVKKSCDWKHCCAIKASNWEFGDPCWGTHKYLEVTYTCRTLRKRPDDIHSVTCENSDAHLKCAYGYVLNIRWADYGRQDKTTCTSTRPYYQTQYDCCSLPRTGTVSRRCDGKRSCYISASNWEFGDPCFGTYKYLEVTYTCDPI